MCCTNIHLTSNPLNRYLTKYYIHFNLLYMTVTHSQNKTLYNRVFYYKFYRCFKVLPVHRTHSKTNHVNKVV